MTTIASAAAEIDRLTAENSALRDELEALQHTDVGEVAAHRDELFHERNQLLGRVRALESEVTGLGGGRR